MALLALTGAALLLGTVAAMALLVRTTEQNFSLFDDERSSPLYCRGSLTQLMEEGPSSYGRAPGEAEVPCLMPRSDYAAPGTGLSPPEALCLLLQRLHLRSPLTGTAPCASA